MATTYSTNLALTLQGTNDNPGTWGNITNTNLGTLIEQAISGYEVQSLTAGTTLTLTIPNGSSGVARNMYLEFTGTGSTVIVPSNKKLYFVYNNCSSGTISFKVAGQTGVNIPNGQKQILVSNGTDIQNVITGLEGTTSTALTAFGIDAGGNITTGTDNAFFGFEAGKAATSAQYNNAFGVRALQSVVGGVGVGFSNTAVGYETLYSCTGKGNTAVGNGSLYYVSTGADNTAAGFGAGQGFTTGSNNSAVGAGSYPSGNYTNSTCLGYQASVTGSNQVQLGNASTTTYAYGAVQNRSDARDKTDIRDTQLGLDFIMALRPRDFKWDMREDYRTPPPGPDASAAEYAAWEQANKLANITHDGTHTRTRYHQGLIAQEVKQTMDAMGVDFGGYQDHTIKGGDAVLTIGYEELVAPLIKAIQELKAEFDEYKRTHP